ncbi:MAG: hypothetical protein HC938_12810, partial [Nitrospira sp.]|nr:hypothetical protein [Nitrospira sp.]
MERPLTQHIHPDGTTRTLREYVTTGGYRCLQRLSSGLAPKDLQRLVTDAGLLAASEPAIRTTIGGTASL